MELTRKQIEMNQKWSRKMMNKAKNNRCIKNCVNQDEFGYCFIHKITLPAYFSPKAPTFFKKHPNCKRAR